MSDLITITIDGKECKAKEGEFILNVARANGIFVPAICYLTRCTPTLACRLCLVEADGKQVYACNAKSKDGMVIKTTTDNIEKERTAIMQVYDVNHPLQCGVCDKSGECELQNYTLYQKVDSQEYAVKDVHRPTTNWGVMNYDPGLCIVCEKCVSVCKDMIGSNALGTVKRGADALDKDYKANMPKDAYAMWNKLNKNLIGFEEDKCSDCGECIAVCPTGAMASTDFQYKSNAWELTRIPASNPHSSDCSLMYYEVKHESIDNNTLQKIYRVTNDSHYTSLSGAARFAFDYSNRVESKDETAFAKAVEAIKNADTITFSSFITNEEALILQKLKEKLGLKLVNKEAMKFKTFMDDFSLVSGKSLYSGNLKDIHASNFLVSVGSYLKNDAPNVRYAFNNAISMNKGAGLYFHPMGDTTVEGFGKKGKTIETITHNVGTEEAILYFILDQFGESLPADTASYLESFRESRKKTVVETIKEKVTEMTVDAQTGEEKEVTKMVPKKVETEVEFTYTKLLDIFGSDETLLETVTTMKDGKDKFSLIIGQDIISHPQSTNLAKLCGLVEKYTNFKVVVIPFHTNTLGVSLICDLDSEVGENVIGYNKKAPFQLSALGDGDLDMPALTQQEGTFTNIDKKVVPTNAALPYNGYTLNDIANEILGIEVENTVDYTKEVFDGIAFDNLANYFLNDFQEHRGYELTSKELSSNDDVVAISDIKDLDGTIIYKANPINQFNEFTAVASQLQKEKFGLYVSNESLETLGLSTGDKVEVSANGESLELEVILDGQISGNISYVPFYDKNVPSCKLFDGYRFNNANIKKV
jgi:NADH-quinone oxidoreductase subunit G